MLQGGRSNRLIIRKEVIRYNNDTKRERERTKGRERAKEKEGEREYLNFIKQIRKTYN